MTYHFDAGEIVALYESGVSVQAIAAQRGTSFRPVKRILEISGVRFRTPAEQYALNVKRDPGLRSRGRERTYPINESYFDQRSPSMAYIVGFMQADGYNNTERGEIRITLKTSDAGHLIEIAREMGAQRPLFPDSCGNPSLDLRSKVLSAGLARWAVVSPKSLTASTHPDLLSDRDYWRGVVDGDGSLCLTKRWTQPVMQLVGSYGMCSQFLDFCRDAGARTKSTVQPEQGHLVDEHRRSRCAPHCLSPVRRCRAGASPRKRATAEQWRRLAVL